MNLSNLYTSSEECATTYDNLRILNATQFRILLWLNITIATMNVAVNSTGILLIIKTKQWKNQSTKLILFMSSSDCCVALLSQIVLSALAYLEDMICVYKTMLLFIWYLPIIFSFNMVAFISFNRFIHIKYLHQYSAILTPKRFNLCLLLLISITVVQSIMTSIGPLFFGKGGGTLFSIPITVIVPFASIGLYIKSVFILRKHEQYSQERLHLTTSVTRLATFYLIILLITFIPSKISLIIVLSLSKYLTKQTKTMLFFGCQLYYCCYSFITGMVFIKVNEPAKKYFGNVYRKLIAAWNKGESPLDEF